MAAERTEADILAAGQRKYRSIVVWELTDDDKGKMVVIDVDSGDYEVDTVEAKARDRLLSRRPDACTWTAEFQGRPVIRMGWRGTYGRLLFDDDAAAFLSQLKSGRKND